MQWYIYNEASETIVPEKDHKICAKGQHDHGSSSCGCKSAPRSFETCNVELPTAPLWTHLADESGIKLDKGRLRHPPDLGCQTWPQMWQDFSRAWKRSFALKPCRGAWWSQVHSLMGILAHNVPASSACTSVASCRAAQRFPVASGKTRGHDKGGAQLSTLRICTRSCAMRSCSEVCSGDQEAARPGLRDASTSHSCSLLSASVPRLRFH